MSSPVLLRYAGDGAFEPANGYFARKADREFVVGTTYTLVEHQERSSAAHNRFFASVEAAWRTLPDALLEEYPSATALRRKMLIRCGYADERSIVCASKAEAQRVAAFIRPMDQYAVVIVRDAVVRVCTAHSQSYRAMGRKEFNESAGRVLDAIANLVGVTLKELNEARAA